MTNDEVIALLREIRDIQRAHFERYQEFTAAALKRQEEAVEMLNHLVASSAKRQEEAAEIGNRLVASSAMSRERAQQYRDQAQQLLIKSRSNFRAIMIACAFLYVLIVALIIVFALARH